MSTRKHNVYGHPFGINEKDRIMPKEENQRSGSLEIINSSRDIKRHKEEKGMEHDD